MDPTATLISIRAIVKTMATPKTIEQLLEDGQDLAELFTALDEWMTRGGFLPTQWRLHR